MKKFATAWLFILIFPAGILAEEITIVFEEWPPYQFTQDKEIVGMDTEVVKEAFRRMGTNIKFRSLPWARALEEVKNGDAHAIFSIAYPDQHQFLHFPKTPISAQRSVFFVRKDSDMKISDISDLEGVSVGVVRDNFYGDRFDKNEKIKRDVANNQFLIFKKLLAKRHDIMISFDVVGLYVAKQMGITDKVKTLDYVVDDQPTYVAFSKAKGSQNTELAKQFSETLEQLHKEGFTEKIRKKYVE